MNAIRSVFAAFANLAASVNGLAAVLDAAAGRLRQQLALDSDPPALPHGEILDNTEGDGAPPAKRGRKAAAAS